MLHVVIIDALIALKESTYFEKMSCPKAGLEQKPFCTQLYAAEHAVENTTY